MASPMVALKAPLMEKKDYTSNFPLKHAQKDMRFALGLGDKVTKKKTHAHTHYSLEVILCV